MLIRKLRIEKGWSQETLAEISDLSVRTIQRIERGGNASLETLSALAAVFEVDIATLATETSMYTQNELSNDEREAVEYVRDIKGFYSHVAIYVVTIAALAGANLYMGTDNLWFVWPALGWGLGVASHGLAVFEILSLFGADWEKRQINKRMQR
ncbi:MAG: Pr2TM family membrane protein [Alphaproteobacteria bacterium]|nr:Pr2TM family membrane protein [Alphaproteobacteria bacterium]